MILVWRVTDSHVVEIVSRAVESVFVVVGRPAASPRLPLHTLRLCCCVEIVCCAVESVSVVEGRPASPAFPPTLLSCSLRGMGYNL